MEKNKKTEIRTEVKRRRAEASLEYLHEASLRIKDRFVKTEAYAREEFLLAYVDAKREVETRLIMQQAWEDGSNGKHCNQNKQKRGLGRNKDNAKISRNFPKVIKNRNI